ncbi:MAG: hypothetical protein SFV22_08660 [Saprospiraceae bacterium]|nr:hypothetical protein [Saprospiraceae bacterium]
MAKKLKMLLLILFSLNFTQIWADETRLPVLNYADECTAPAPDSLRVEDANEDYIRLAWIPAWPGATHTLEVLQETSTGGWASLFTVYNVAGSSYDVYGLNHIGTKYRFVLATNCPETGDPSVITTHFDWIGLILDLVMGGRTPINPQVVPECTSVNYEEHEWVGFKIYVPGSVPGSIGYDYFFEFAEGYEDGKVFPVIMRSSPTSFIVAGNGAELFPWIPEPEVVRINGSHEFHMYRIKGIPTPYRFGRIEVLFDGVNKTVSICKNAGTFWDPVFYLYTLTATSATGLQSADSSFKENTINSFEKKFNVFFLDKSLYIDIVAENGEKTKINSQLISITGQILFDFNAETFENKINVSLPSLPNGLFFIKTCIDGKNCKTSKLININ